MSKYVERYKHQLNKGFSHIEAFGIVASSIAMSGTIDDLREVDRELWNSFNDKHNTNGEEMENESITTAI